MDSDNPADDFQKLTRELEKEKEIKLHIEVSIKDLEESMGELETYLRDMDEVCEKGEDDEWKIRYNYQNSFNAHLTNEKSLLKRELEEIKWKSYYEQYPDYQNQSLEQITEEELYRLVKHMEKIKLESTQALKESEQKLEHEQRHFRALDTARKAYKTDLAHARDGEENKKVEKLVEKHVQTVTQSIYSPSYRDYIARQPLRVTRASYEDLRSRQ